MRILKQLEGEGDEDESNETKEQKAAKVGFTFHFTRYKEINLSDKLC